MPSTPPSTNNHSSSITESSSLPKVSLPNDVAMRLEVVESSCLVEECNENGWKEMSNKAGIRICVNKETPPTVRVVAVIEAISPTIIFPLLKDMSLRQSWDTGAKDCEIFATIDGTTDIQYTKIKGMLGMSSRDFVDYRRWRILTQSENRADEPPSTNENATENLTENEETSYIIYFSSGEHPLHPITSDCVRAETILSGVILRPFYDTSSPRKVVGCTVTSLNQCDIKGSIPPYLLTKAAVRSAADWFKSLKLAAVTRQEQLQQQLSSKSRASSTAEPVTPSSSLLKSKRDMQSPSFSSTFTSPSEMRRSLSIYRIGEGAEVLTSFRREEVWHPHLSDALLSRRHNDDDDYSNITCEKDSADVSVFFCSDCDMYLCDGCGIELHRSSITKNHTMKRLLRPELRYLRQRLRQCRRSTLYQTVRAISSARDSKGKTVTVELKDLIHKLNIRLQMEEEVISQTHHLWMQLESTGIDALRNQYSSLDCLDLVSVSNQKVASIIEQSRLLLLPKVNQGDIDGGSSDNVPDGSKDEGEIRRHSVSNDTVSSTNRLSSSTISNPSSIMQPQQLCSHCTESDAILHCVECDKYYCYICSDVLHKNKKRKDHQRKSLELQKYNENNKLIIKCRHCTEALASMQCLECATSVSVTPCNASETPPATTITNPSHDDPNSNTTTTIPSSTLTPFYYCQECDDVLHKNKKKRNHQRTVLPDDLIPSSTPTTALPPATVFTPTTPSTEKTHQATKDNHGLKDRKPASTGKRKEMFSLLSENCYLRYRTNSHLEAIYIRAIDRAEEMAKQSWGSSGSLTTTTASYISKRRDINGSILQLPPPHELTQSSISPSKPQTHTTAPSSAGKASSQDATTTSTVSWWQFWKREPEKKDDISPTKTVSPSTILPPNRNGANVNPIQAILDSALSSENDLHLLSHCHNLSTSSRHPLSEVSSIVESPPVVESEALSTDDMHPSLSISPVKPSFSRLSSSSDPLSPLSIPPAPTYIIKYNEDFVRGIKWLQDAIESLNKKLQLTCVEKLSKLVKYKYFSVGELTVISNGHIEEVCIELEGLKKLMGMNKKKLNLKNVSTMDDASGTEFSTDYDENVFLQHETGEYLLHMIQSNATLRRQLNDYALVINKELMAKLEKGRLQEQSMYKK